MAVKVAVTNNLVAVKGHQVAVVLGWSGSEGLPGSGNPACVVMSVACGPCVRMHLAQWICEKMTDFSRKKGTYVSLPMYNMFVNK